MNLAIVLELADRKGMGTKKHCFVLDMVIEFCYLEQETTT